MSQHDDSIHDNRDTPHFLNHSNASLAGVLERVETQMLAELGANNLPATDPAERRAWIGDVLNYVLVAEGIQLSRQERLWIQQTTYQDLFRLGPLAEILTDPRVTEIEIRRADEIYIRYGTADLTLAPITFEDDAHLLRVLRYALLPQAIELLRHPLLECSLLLESRPIRLSVAGPPYTNYWQVTLRLHPFQPYQLADLTATGYLDQTAVTLLMRIMQSGHGLLIAGEAMTGKTTLLQNLLPAFRTQQTGVVVERAREIALPDKVRSVTPTADETFAQALWRAIDKPSTWLALDELRFDEVQALWDTLSTDKVRQRIYVMRGSTELKRLKTAFGMAIRRGKPNLSQADIDQTLLAQLPFVALTSHSQHQLKLLQIGEWQRDDMGQIFFQPLWPSSQVAPQHQLLD